MRLGIFDVKLFASDAIGDLHVDSHVAEGLLPRVLVRLTSVLSIWGHAFFLLVLFFFILLVIFLFCCFLDC